MLPSVRESAGDVVFAIHAKPGSSRDRIEGTRGDALQVAVSAAPERGKANRAIIEVLAKALGLKRSQISIDRGEKSRAKQVRIHGVDRGALEVRLRRALEGSSGPNSGRSEGRQRDE